MVKQNRKSKDAGIPESGAAVGESVGLAGTGPVAGQGESLARLSRSPDGRIRYHLRDAEQVIDRWHEEISAIEDFAEAVRLLAHKACDARGIEAVREPLEPLFRIVRLLTERLHAMEFALEVATRGDGLDGAKIAVEIGSRLVPEEDEAGDNEGTSARCGAK